MDDQNRFVWVHQLIVSKKWWNVQPYEIDGWSSSLCLDAETSCVQEVVKMFGLDQPTYEDFIHSLSEIVKEEPSLHFVAENDWKWLCTLSLMSTWLIQDCTWF